MCKVDRMRNWLLVMSVLVLGCGDNSRTCGLGTKVEDGVCLPSVTCGAGTIVDEETGDCVLDGTRICAIGTRFDPVTRTCQIDPSACQNGTVLIGGECLDPTAGMIVDLEEGPEPNGLEYLERSTIPAGRISVQGSTFIVHGTLAPRGGKPDADTYTISVPGPTLLEITVAGVGGVATGFYMDDALFGRYGIDIGHTSSTRQVYVDAQGAELSVADTGVLYDIVNMQGLSGEGGRGDYYLSVTPIPMPAPTLLEFPSTTTGMAPRDQILFYQATLPPSAYHDVRLAMPSSLATAALIVTTPATTNPQRGAEDDEFPGAPAHVRARDTALIMVDNGYALGGAPIEFTLTLE